MTFDPPLLDRVRKLLALSSSPNIHEAATAAALAQTLIARHRLQSWLDAEQAQAEDADPLTDGRDQPLELSKRLRKWKVVLACMLADANGCVAYTLVLGKDEAICVVGRNRDRQAVAALWTSLVSRIEWLSATHGAGQDRRWHEAFRVGVVAAVAEKLAAVAGEVRSELPQAALVSVDPAALAHQRALERFVAERLKLGKGRGLRFDADPWAQGQKAGAHLEIPRPGR